MVPGPEVIRIQEGGRGNKRTQSYFRLPLVSTGNKLRLCHVGYELYCLKRYGDEKMDYTKMSKKMRGIY